MSEPETGQFKKSVACSLLSRVARLTFLKTNFFFHFCLEYVYEGCYGFDPTEHTWMKFMNVEHEPSHNDSFSTLGLEKNANFSFDIDAHQTLDLMLQKCQQICFEYSYFALLSNDIRNCVCIRDVDLSNLNGKLRDYVCAENSLLGLEVQLDAHTISVYHHEQSKAFNGIFCF